MLIGELVKKSKISKDTIRYYENTGLIHSSRNKSNNYKDYPQTTVQILSFITKTQSLGFSLKEIKSILDLISQDDYECSEIEEMIESKLELIEVKIQNLQNMKKNLLCIKEMIDNDQVIDEFTALEKLSI